MNEEGEYIELADILDEHYVRGHVSPQVAIEAINRHYANDIGSNPYTESDFIFRRCFGRWSCDGRLEYKHCLDIYGKPGRGRFKITRMIYKK